MNDRIKEFAEQAKEYASKFAYVQAIGHPGYWQVYNEKFAELIVAECMQIIKVDMYEDAISNMWSKNKLQMIKQHFGVAE